MTFTPTFARLVPRAGAPATVLPFRPRAAAPQMRPAFRDGPCGCEGETAAMAHLRSVLLNVPMERLTFYQQDRVRSARDLLRDYTDAVRRVQEGGR